MRSSVFFGNITRLPGRALLLGTLLLAAAAHSQTITPLRPPSVPLVACDPYFSIWSPGDKLTDKGTVHWTGKSHPLHALVRIDGRPYRLMGAEPASVPPLPQRSVEVLPTRTLCVFEGAGLRLSLTFMTATLPEDLMIYSRPVTYLTFQAESLDGAGHSVQAYVDAGAELAVNTPDQSVRCSESSSDGLRVLSVGSVDQPILQKKGDDLRIDWGHLFLAAPRKQAAEASLGNGARWRDFFGAHGRLPPSMSGGVSAKVSDQAPVLAMTLDLGQVREKPVSRWLMLAYDDEYSIQYFKQNLRPYWRRNGDDARALLRKAAADYGKLVKRCADFDARLMAALTAAGGEKYARICALAYRQCAAGNKVVADANGQPLMFPKENFSNGCIGTVDIIYPMAPQFLLLSPSLVKAMMVPILDYASSPRWRWPFAPHDLGTYPLANGQVYGGGERTEENQMPVEETGNMLLLLAALAQVEGNVDFCAKYWPVLQKWADYLEARGFDPENQLCTDDFAGHLAHNVNLSAKAICGLGAYARLCEMRGDKAKAGRLMSLTGELAARWVREADDGDHYRLAFDRPGTWSQKYNLVWDRILGLNLFPESVLRKEMVYYKQNLNAFGLPLDNRKQYTKLDWTIWTATLTRNRSDFEALVDPVFRFLNETPERIPMTDWYWTQNAKHPGFQARSVVGGVFIQMLYDPSGWRKWAREDKTRAAKWAPLPQPTPVITVIPTSEKAPVAWRYTTKAPPEDWFTDAFNDGGWSEGPGGFGTRGTPGSVVGTEWNGPAIWLRRQFELPPGKWNGLKLRVHHDEDAEIYLNGAPAARLSGYTTDYEEASIEPQARATLKPGRNVIAVRCRQTSGGQFIDVGLVDTASRQ